MSHEQDSYAAKDDKDGYNPKHVEDEGDFSRSRSSEPVRPEPSSSSDRSRPREEPHQDDQVLFPSRELDRDGDQGELFGREQLVGYEFRGPVPPPELIAKYDQLAPGAGQRILDDAHENEVLDRHITKKSFDAAVRLELGGFIAAILIVISCLVLAAVSIFAFKNNVGGAIFGLGAAAPIVLGFLGNRSSSTRSDKSSIQGNT